VGNTDAFIATIRQIEEMLMRLNIARTSLLITLFISIFDVTFVVGQTVVINFSDRGWYSESGQHLTFNWNYAVGDGRGPFCGSCFSDTRNFFVFDMAGITQPIASAKLALEVPLGGYRSSDPSENYELHDIVTPLATLLNGTGGVAAHADLGSGVVYGSRTMTAADRGSIVEITLNASAIAALNEATGLIGIGGSITTLDGLANDEFTFGFTNSLTNPEFTRLRLTLVPEPSSGFLCLVGVATTLTRRKRTRV
jgi:hypothetical protein